MSEEEIIQEIEKLELEEEKEKTVKYLLKVVIEGKKDIIQEKEFFLEEKEKEIEELKKEIKKLTRLNSAYKTNYDSKVLKEERKNKKILEGYISKDKIREKIKELSKTQAYKVGLEEYTIKILRELLEE